jgi:phosphoribosylaminoimidazole-succinocarboxamide synthase
MRTSTQTKASFITLPHRTQVWQTTVTSLFGPTLSSQLSSLALSLYSTAHQHCLTQNLILADTKFEFALDSSTSPPSLILVDEILTPDSSRFWPADKYEPGRSQESFDKQFLRDWLSTGGVGGREGVVMPEWVVEGTEGRYREVLEKVTGRGLEKWMRELEEL